MTDNQFPLLLWAVVFFGFAIIVCIIRAHREKNKTFYLGAGVAFLALLAFISVSFQQAFLFFFFAFSAAAIGVVASPKINKLVEQKTAKNLREVDISAPLKAKDLFTQTCLLKTAYKYGVRKAVFLFCLLMAAAIVGGLLIVGPWLGMSVDFIAPYTFSFTIPTIAIYYRTISKGLKSIERKRCSIDR